MIAVGLVAMAAQQQIHAISLDVGTAGDAVLRFTGTGDTYTFIDSTTGPSTGFDFIVNGSDGVGDSLGLFGSISGIFTIGAITVGPGFQTAPVTGTGTLNIFDGSGNLSANIFWTTIFSSGTTVAMNNVASLNVQNVTYTGSVLDLIALRDTLSGQAVASFSSTFIPSRTLTQLTQDGQVNNTSFSGDIQADTIFLTPDGGATVGMLGLGLLALAAFRRKQ